MANDLHYLKKVEKHPERDIELPVRIVDQTRDVESNKDTKPKFSSLVSDCDLKHIVKNRMDEKSIVGLKRKFHDTNLD